MEYKIKSKVGKFYIGDPMFALKSENYNMWKKEYNYDENIYEINGIQFIAHTIEIQNSGSYIGSDGKLYISDSGFIALIPFELVDDCLSDQCSIIHANEASLIYEFGDFTINYDNQTLVIPTCEYDE